MDYIVWNKIDKSEEYLCHYGVKGMKWGVRHVDNRGYVHDIDGNVSNATHLLSKKSGYDEDGNYFDEYTVGIVDRGLSYPTGVERVTQPKEVKRHEDLNKLLSSNANPVIKGKGIFDFLVETVSDIFSTTISNIKSWFK